MNDLNETSNYLFDLLFLLNRRIFNHSEFIKGLPLAPSHVKVIFHLMHSGPSPVSQIARDLSISKPNMTPIIDRLIQDGFVTRFEDPNDRRVIRVQITEKSKELFKFQKQLVKDTLKIKLSHLDNEDLETLQNSIKVITNIIGKLPK